MDKINTVKCPTCNATVKWHKSNHYRPFCSERCRLIDLGEWLDEKKVVPGEPYVPDE